MVDTADSSVKLSIKNGELWCGDCLDLMRDIPSGSVDMILCDLPYGTTRNKWDTVIPFAPLWAEYWRICRGPVVLTAAQPFTSALVMSCPDRFKYEWIWVKTRPVGHLNAKKMPMAAHESALVFGDGNIPYNPQDLVYKPRMNKRTPTKGNYDDAGKENFSEFTNYPRTTIEFDSLQSEKIHPTQKPVALFEYLIKTYTNEGDTVLDNCLGSGTTAIAAENTGRRWIGIERDLTYCMSAWDRVMKHQPSSLRTTM